MKSRVFRATLQALLAVSVLGASLAIRADEATADLQAGIDAFNRGDLPGAMTLYEKAAEAGSPEAQVRLAYLLDYAEDNEEAVHWYRAAADQEYADGIAGLAAMYAKGEGVAQDHEAGHAGSIRVLISAYEKGGLDVEKDATRAAYWKDKQASLGSNGN
jgi:TPR repeat protein